MIEIEAETLDKLPSDARVSLGPIKVSPDVLKKMIGLNVPDGSAPMEEGRDTPVLPLVRGVKTDAGQNDEIHLTSEPIINITRHDRGTGRVYFTPQRASSGRP